MEKKGKGKKAGSVSFSEVSLAELNRVFQPEAMIPISKRFAETMGLENKPIAASERAARLTSLAVPPVKLNVANLNEV